MYKNMMQGGGTAVPQQPAQTPPQGMSFESDAGKRQQFKGFMSGLADEFRNRMSRMQQPPIQAPMVQPMQTSAIPYYMSNIDIFEQPMKFMGGGSVPRQTSIAGQPHMLSYITPGEADVLKSLGGAGAPGPGGIPSFYYDEAGMGIGGGYSSGVDDSAEFGGGYGGGGSYYDDSAGYDYSGFYDEGPQVSPVSVAPMGEEIGSSYTLIEPGIGGGDTGGGGAGGVDASILAAAARDEAARTAGTGVTDTGPVQTVAERAGVPSTSRGPGLQRFDSIGQAGKVEAVGKGPEAVDLFALGLDYGDNYNRGNLAGANVAAGGRTGEGTPVSPEAIAKQSFTGAEIDAQLRNANLLGEQLDKNAIIAGQIAGRQRDYMARTPGLGLGEYTIAPRGVIRDGKISGTIYSRGPEALADAYGFEGLAEEFNLPSQVGDIPRTITVAGPDGRPREVTNPDYLTAAENLVGGIRAGLMSPEFVSRTGVTVDTPTGRVPIPQRIGAMISGKPVSEIASERGGTPYVLSEGQRQKIADARLSRYYRPEQEEEFFRNRPMTLMGFNLAGDFKEPVSYIDPNTGIRTQSEFRRQIQPPGLSDYFGAAAFPISALLPAESTLEVAANTQRYDPSLDPSVNTALRTQGGFLNMVSNKAAIDKYRAENNMAPLPGAGDALSNMVSNIGKGIGSIFSGTRGGESASRPYTYIGKGGVPYYGYQGEGDDFGMTYSSAPTGGSEEVAPATTPSPQMVSPGTATLTAIQSLGSPYRAQPVNLSNPLGYGYGSYRGYSPNLDSAADKFLKLLSGYAEGGEVKGFQYGGMADSDPYEAEMAATGSADLGSSGLGVSDFTGGEDQRNEQVQTVIAKPVGYTGGEQSVIATPLAPGELPPQSRPAPASVPNPLTDLQNMQRQAVADMQAREAQGMLSDIATQPTIGSTVGSLLGDLFGPGAATQDIAERMAALSGGRSAPTTQDIVQSAAEQLARSVPGSAVSPNYQYGLGYQGPTGQITGTAAQQNYTGSADPSVSGVKMGDISTRRDNNTTGFFSDISVPSLSEVGRMIMGPQVGYTR